MKESLKLRENFNVTPSTLYKAWLDSNIHSEMTGGEAICSNKVGDAFSAWDGYISGENVELIKNKKIVQTWRTNDFNENDEDSILTLEFLEVPEGTQLILTHNNIPEGQTQYKQGWIDSYLSPLKEYFSD